MMSSTCKRLAALAALFRASTLLALALCLPLLSQAQRRDFAGSYQFSNIADEGDNVSLTIRLTIHNFSATDVRDGAVALFDADAPNANPIAAFDLKKVLPSYREIAVTQRITVAKSQYSRWCGGEKPSLKFVLPDAEEGTRTVPLDLHREPAPLPLAK